MISKLRLLICTLWKVKLSLSLTWRHISGRKGIYAFIFNLTTRLRRAANSTLPPQKSNWYPLHRKLSGPQSCSGHFREEKYLLPPTLYHRTGSLLNILNTLPWLVMCHFFLWIFSNRLSIVIIWFNKSCTSITQCHVTHFFLLLHRAFWQHLCSYHQQMHFFITHIKC